jgi:hypothetical protein
MRNQNVIIADKFTVGTKQHHAERTKNNRKTSHISMEQNGSVKGRNHVI